MLSLPLSHSLIVFHERDGLPSVVDEGALGVLVPSYVVDTIGLVVVPGQDHCAHQLLCGLILKVGLFGSI